MKCRSILTVSVVCIGTVGFHFLEETKALRGGYAQASAENDDRTSNSTGADASKGRKQNIHFRSYGDAKFERAKERIRGEANRTGWFDTVEVWSPEDLPADFRRTYAAILAMPRGGGYWIWKIPVMDAALETMEEGDFLVYADAGCRVNGEATERFRRYLRDLDESPYGVHCQQMGLPEHRYTTKRIFDLLGVPEDDAGVRDTGQYRSTYVMMQKNDHSREFLRRVRSALEEDALAFTDVYNREAKRADPRFRDNRHDQSVFSVVHKQIGCAVFPDEYKHGNLNYPFWISRSRLN